VNSRVIRRILAAAIVIACASPVMRAAGAERPLTLDEAIAFALEKNEAIVISREAAAAAKAAVSGARGVYNPLFELEGGWSRAKVPVNSAFSGAPLGEGAPTTEGVEARAELSQYLPTGATLSLRASTARGTTNGTFDLLSPAYQTQVGVALRQPLLRNLFADSERSTIRIANADQARSTAELEVEITATVAEVERAYWDLAAARAEVTVREEAVRLAEEQLQETETRVESGAAPETEVAQPRAEVERRRGELLAGREAAVHAETRLKLLILGDGDDDLWIATLAPEVGGAPETPAVDREASIARALELRPEIDAAQASIERRQAERAFARDGTRPMLDAVVSYDRFGIAGSANPAATDAGGDPVTVPDDYDGEWGRSWEMLGDGDFDDVFAGLVFSFPIGNDQAQADEAIARHGERQAQAALTRVRKTIRAEVLDAAAALETAGQRIEAARAGREAAEIQLSAEQDRYDVGLSTNFLVLTRQNDLSSARLDEISAHADYRVARTALARATGTLLDEHGIRTDATER
jgi:outer membrane protein TolC